HRPPTTSTRLPYTTLFRSALEAWRVNNAINLNLVNAIPKKGFDAVPLASRGRTVAKQLAHMQKVHSGWLKYNGARLSRDARPLQDRKSTRLNSSHGSISYA